MNAQERILVVSHSLLFTCFVMITLIFIINLIFIMKRQEWICSKKIDETDRPIKFLVDNWVKLRSEMQSNAWLHRPKTGKTKAAETVQSNAILQWKKLANNSMNNIFVFIPH